MFLKKNYIYSAIILLGYKYYTYNEVPKELKRCVYIDL